MSPAVVLLGLRLLLALALYAFLTIILIALWRDLRAAPPAAALTPPAHVTVEGGLLHGRAFDLAASNLVGRSPENGVSLRDSTVSAYHARLTFQGGQWLLDDLGSRNGTRVNAIPLDGPMVVTYGDVIAVGSVSLRLQAGPAADDRAPAGFVPPEGQAGEPPDEGGRA